MKKNSTSKSKRVTLTELTKLLTEEAIARGDYPRLTSHIENIDWNKVNAFIALGDDKTKFRTHKK